MSESHSWNLLIALKMQPELEDERTHTNKQEKMFFILQCINSISMFIKALRNKMCDVKISIFFFFDMLPGSKFYPVEEIQFFLWCEDIA